MAREPAGVVPFRVVLADDDASLRTLTRILLERSKRFEVVGEAEDGQAAIEQARATQPDLVLLDLAMPGVDGLAALPGLRLLAPESKVVAFSMMPQERYAAEALSRGAVAFLDKATDSEVLIRRLVQIMEGNPTPRAAQGGGRPLGGAPRP